MSRHEDNSRPSTHSFEQILDLAKELSSVQSVYAALVMPSTAAPLAGFAKAVGEGLIKPILIGTEAQIDQYINATNLKIDSDNKHIVEQPFEAVRLAAKLVHDRDCDIIVRGNIGSNEFLASLGSTEAEFVGKKDVLSHVAILKPQRYPKLLLVTDGVVNDEPDIMTKVAIVNNAASLCNKIGVDNPRTAVLAAVEVIYPQMVSTTDGAILSRMCDRRQIKGAIIDGPLSFDIAVDGEAAAAKGITKSEVAGRTDLMLAPNSYTANGIYKAMTEFGGCESAGVLVGGRAPVAMAARLDKSDALYHSIATCRLLVG